MTDKIMTVAEVAKQPRSLAEMTAKHSQNWDNFEAICRDAIKSAYDGGKGA